MFVSPSILNANYLNLERDIKQLENAGADAIHIDIMDGRFVEHATWGASTISAIRKVTTLPLEIHLMIEEPERSIKKYIETGADSLMIHPESTVSLRRILKYIKQENQNAGVALKLETPVESILHCLDLLDIVLLLTCDEGFGGEPFQEIALDKINQVAELRNNHQLNFNIAVDGGIGLETGRLCKAAGADILVAGAYIFRHDKTEAIESLKNI